MSAPLLSPILRRTRATRASLCHLLSPLTRAPASYCLDAPALLPSYREPNRTPLPHSSLSLSSLLQHSCHHTRPPNPLSILPRPSSSPSLKLAVVFPYLPDDLVSSPHCQRLSPFECFGSTSAARTASLPPRLLGELPPPRHCPTRLPSPSCLHRPPLPSSSPEPLLAATPPCVHRAR
jgi:hypothetical protein